MKILNYNVTETDEFNVIDIKFTKEFKKIKFIKIEIENFLNKIEELPKFGESSNNIYSHNQIDISFSKMKNSIKFEIDKTTQLIIFVILKVDNIELYNNSSFILPITKIKQEKLQTQENLQEKYQKKQIYCGIKNENISAMIIKKT
jgi:hypothetical protein